MLVVATHPDDECIGVGGTILRRKASGATVAWLLVTSISLELGWTADQITKRANEIGRISDFFGFDAVYELGLPPTLLDSLPIAELISKIYDVFEAFEPEEVFIPHWSDVHTDHQVVFSAASSCTKWFRSPSIKRVLAYETLSETDFGLSSDTFRPNVYVDISPFVEAKVQAMNIYESELGQHPFPRSSEAIRALAVLRGATSGYQAAESFQLLKERS